jgi:hypothetical protein
MDRTTSKDDEISKTVLSMPFLLLLSSESAMIHERDEMMKAWS